MRQAHEIRKQFIEDKVIKAIVRLLTDEFIDLIAAETYLLIQAENNDGEIKRLGSGQIVGENIFKMFLRIKLSKSTVRSIA